MYWQLVTFIIFPLFDQSNEKYLSELFTETPSSNYCRVIPAIFTLVIQLFTAMIITKF